MESGFSFDKSKGENGALLVTAAVSQTALDAVADKVLADFRPHVEIKGFRKGRVPDDIIRTRYKDAIASESEEHLAEQAWAEFAKAESLSVFGNPELTKRENNGTLKFTYLYYPQPSVKLPDLSKIKVERENWSIDDAVVDAAFEIYKKEYGKSVEDNDKVIEAGDMVTCDLTYLNEKFGRYNKKEIRLRAASDKEDFVFAQAIIGMKAGGQKEVATVMQGEKAAVKITVSKIETLIPSTFTDEEKEKADNIKKFLRQQLETATNGKKESELIKAIDDALLEKVTLAIPKGFLDTYADALMSRVQERTVSRTGLKFEEYLAFTGKTEDELKAEQRKDSEREITLSVLRGEIFSANKNDIKVNEEQMNMYARELYQRETQQGLAKRTKEEQQTIMRRIASAAQEYGATAAINEFVKGKVTVTDKKGAAYVPTRDDLFFWR
ncbi:MAG: trigger factor [Spirochaetota bacterium]